MKTSFRTVYFVSVVVCVVIAVAGVSFYTVGSPAHQRLLRLDERRLGDMQSLQYEIVSYWQTTGKLPTALSQLNDDIRGRVVPKDPQTGREYGYEVLGKLSFQLCAAFSTEVQNVPELYPVPESIAQHQWDHHRGTTCFERTIDPERYKTQNEPPLAPATKPLP